MARILAIDDDPSLLDMVAMALEDDGHDVSTAPDGRAGLALHNASPYDAVVSDVSMPHLDGYALCRRLRDAGDPTPLLILTARDTEIDEALALDLGADDFLVKPVSARILQARLRAALRRNRPPTPAPSHGLHLDMERMQVALHGQQLTVTVTEIRLLEALTTRPGIVQSRDQLLARARQDDSVVAPRIIDTYVRRLRRKFEAIDADFDAIETVIGAGYRWRA